MSESHFSLTRAALSTCAAVLAASLVPAVPAQAAVLSCGLDEFYSGTPPTGTGPWLVVTADDHGGMGSVSLTIQGTSLQGTEFISDTFLNLDPSLSPTSLVFAQASQTGTFDSPAISTGVDAFKADGTGGLYDIEFAFATANGHRFVNGDSITYTVTGIPTLTAGSFNFGTPDTGIVAGAHVQSIGSGGLSGYIGGDVFAPIPEPTSLALLAVGALLAALRRNREGSTTWSRGPAPASLAP